MIVWIVRGKRQMNIKLNVQDQLSQWNLSPSAPEHGWLYSTDSMTLGVITIDSFSRGQLEDFTHQIQSPSLVASDKNFIF